MFFYSVLLFRLSTVLFPQIGILLLIIGIYYNKNKIFSAWFLSVLLYIFLIPKTNQIHSYYQIHILPIGAFFIGKTLYELYKKKYFKYVSYVLLFLLFLLSILNVVPMYSMYADSAFKAGNKLQEIDTSNSLVL